VVLSPLSQHGNSNLLISLEGHDIPLVIRLITRSGVDEERNVDALIIFQVKGRSPKAGSDLPVDKIGSVVDKTLYQILDGINPGSAVPLSASPEISDTSFLELDGTLYVRTRHSLLWPGFLTRVRGAGGWAVFAAPLSSPVLIGQGDEILRVNLKRLED
jgi:hypothetical protein